MSESENEGLTMAGMCAIIKDVGVETQVQSGCAAVIGSESVRKIHCRGLSMYFGGLRGRETGRGSVHVSTPVSRLFCAVESAEEGNPTTLIVPCWGGCKRSNRGDWAMAHHFAVFSGRLSLETKKNRNFFKKGLDICENACIILGKGLKSLKSAVAADIGATSEANNIDRSMLGRLGRGNPGVSDFTISTQPSFFRALKCAGKGCTNPQNQEVATW